MSKLIEENRLQRLKLIYGIALAFIALTILSSSFLMQHVIKHNTGDSRVINLSGRQRMLSQRLTKCILTLEKQASPDEVAQLKKELIESFSSWKAAHAGLQHGDEKQELPKRENSPEICALFNEMEPFHVAMVKALDGIESALEGGKVNLAAVHTIADTMLGNESLFWTLWTR